MPHSQSSLDMIIKVLMSQRAIIGTLKEHISNSRQPITVEQLIVLAFIKENGLVSQQELALLTVKDKSTIHRIIIDLGKKGFVLVQVDRNDRRRNLVGLTDQGRIIWRQFCEKTAMSFDPWAKTQGPKNSLGLCASWLFQE